MKVEELGPLAEELARAMEPGCWALMDKGQPTTETSARIVASISHAATCIRVLVGKGLL